MESPSISDSDLAVLESIRRHLLEDTDHIVDPFTNAGACNDLLYRWNVSIDDFFKNQHTITDSFNVDEFFEPVECPDHENVSPEVLNTRL
ncbi:hypothetical protein DCAR_0414856 [Daucus carota subsp. sativus]|uniref:Uncharacterized protein n=1 Tax=Daucus carota subsp. sativus TaxID=79200 RepID=A0AAF0WTJ8_DAUCS|nr:hypothetical protein DCAR_0414856 [Daucus carota subsp. sativus]